MRSFARAASFAFGLAMSASASQAAGQPAAVAVIDIAPTDNGVRIQGRALALSAGRFDARMRIAKDGRGGRTATTQGGSATLEAGGSADIATVGLSMAPGDRLEVELVLTSDGTEVARNTLVVGDNRI